MADKTLQVLVKGRVQGVFFRAFVKQNAQALGVKGFVRNRPDGSVEAVCFGNKNVLSKLLKKIKQGPMLARVEKVEAKEIAKPELNESFEVVN